MKSPNEVCPLANNEDNHKERYCPRNARAAFCFQLHDTLRVLYGLSPYSGERDAWNEQLNVLESQIKLARNV